jgi:hypothetical protein
MNPAEIVKRATLESARYLGQDQQMGSIEKSKLATQLRLWVRGSFGSTRGVDPVIYESAYLTYDLANRKADLPG